MLCDICNVNSATYHSKVNINGNVTETHLCSDCVKNKKHEHHENTVVKAPHVSSFLDEMFSENNAEVEKRFNNSLENHELEPICEGCGAKYEEFLKNGLLSCSECYNTFYGKLLPIIATMQHGTEHKGKTQKFDEKDEKSAKIRDLEFSLKQAVANENYELASELKKEIINLKSLQGGES